MLSAERDVMPNGTLTPAFRRTWSSRAKALMAALALVGVVAACSSDDDDAEEDAATETTDSSTETEGTDVGDVDPDTDGDGEIDDAEAEAAAEAAEAAAAELASVQEAAAATEAELATTQEQLATAEEAVAVANVELEAATEENAALTAEVETQAAAAAEAQGLIDAFLAFLPATVSSDIVGPTVAQYNFDPIGAYTMRLTEAYCAALPICGTQRPEVRADIIQGPNGLQLQVPGLLTTGLFAIEGSLFGVTATDQIVPGCDGELRRTQVATTIFADGVVINPDGTRTLSGLGASLLVTGDASGSCGPGDVFYSVDLIRL
jgi:hypothetical protein